MKTLLIFPPVWNVHAPYLSLPLLAANLRKAGHHVDIMDCNIDFFDRILTPTYLARALERTERIEKRSNGNATQCRLRKACIMIGSSLIASIDKAKKSYRSTEGFKDPMTYEWSRNVFGASLNLISSSFPGLRLDFNNVNFRNRSHESSQEMIASVEDTECNIFSAYYNEVLRPMISDSGYGLIGFSVADRGQLLASLTFAAEIKRNFGDSIKILVGGNFFTRIARRWSAPHPFHKFIDYIILMEGENAIVELVDAVINGGDLNKVSNLCYVDGERLRFTEIKSVDINTAPFPDFTGFPLDLYFLPALVLPTYTSRSCSWNRCTFCTIAGASSKFRTRSAERIGDELEYLVKRFGTSYFTFIDESMTPGIVKKMADVIIHRKMNIRWYGEARLVPGFTDEVLNKTWQSGARLLQFGLESYNQRVMDMINKGIKEKDVLPLLERCLKSGIAFHLFCFVGFPTETREEAARTLSFTHEIIRKADDEYGNPYCTKGIGTFGLEIGTPIYENPQAFGITLKAPRHGRDLGLDARYTVSSGLTAEEAQQMLDNYTGVDIYKELSEREGTFFYNRIISGMPPREEETFIRWCNYKDGGASKKMGRRSSPNRKKDSGGGLLIEKAPWVTIIDGHSNILGNLYDPPVSFVYDSRKCGIFPLSEQQKLLLDRIGEGWRFEDCKSGIKSDLLLHKNLVRLEKLGIILASPESVWAELFPDNSADADVLPFGDIRLYCLSNERYVLFDMVREKVVSLNHTGAMLWKMLGEGKNGRKLLDEVQQMYGRNFLEEYLTAFLNVLRKEGVLFFSISWYRQFYEEKAKGKFSRT